MQERARAGVDDRPLASPGDVPDPGGAVLASRREQASVDGPECAMHDRTLVAAQGRSLGGCRDVPDSRGAVLARRGKEASVGAEGAASDGALVAAQNRSLVS
jgi:hypothetical protein